MMGIPDVLGHPSHERLRTFADGEVTPAQRTRVARHLERCTHCRKSIALLRIVRVAAREDLAPAAPEAAIAKILARRAAGERRILPPPHAGGAPSARARRGRSWLRAAGIAVAVTLGAAGVAAALSAPLRDRIATVLGIARPGAAAASAADSARPMAADAAPATGPGTEAQVAGTAIESRAESLWVNVEARDPQVRLRVRVTDGRRLEVRGIDAAAAAVFRPRSDGIGVTVPAAGELQLHLPKAARHVIVRLNGVPYLIKEGGQLRVLAPGADTIGTDLLLIPSR